MILQRIGARIAARMVGKRPPDFVIGGAERPYLRRWFVIPRNPVFNVYLHHFLRSDDDRALHDHPWASLTLMIFGEYTEHRIADGGIHHRRVVRFGDLLFRASGRIAHRIELHNGPCWTLFITGPRYRTWGFHCPEQGWIDWKRFTAPDDRGAIGKGCDA